MSSVERIYARWISFELSELILSLYVSDKTCKRKAKLLREMANLL